MSKNSESGWLIEHPVQDIGPRYVCLDGEDIRWTGSPYKAFRLGRREDAELFCSVFMMGFGKAVEHAWDLR